MLKQQGTPFRLHLLTQYPLRGRGRCIERARWTAQTTPHHSMLCVGNCGGSIRRQQGSARAALLASAGGRSCSEAGEPIGHCPRESEYAWDAKTRFTLLN